MKILFFETRTRNSFFQSCVLRRKREIENHFSWSSEKKWSWLSSRLPGIENSRWPLVGGLPSPPWLVSYQDLDCGRSEVFAVQLERVQQGQGCWWGAFGSGLDPRDRSSHLISPRYLTIGDQKQNICFWAFSLSTLWQRLVLPLIHLFCLSSNSEEMW